MSLPSPIAFLGTTEIFVILGIVVLLMGLVFLVVFRLFQRTAKLAIHPPSGLAGAPLLGIAFGLGWTPCLGPTLAAISALSLTTGNPARGALLAKTGGAVVRNGRTTLGPTMECFTCHGQKLEGTLLGPPIAGRSPSYIARQLYDMKMGTRKGDIAVATMKASVERLSTDDILALAAYVSSVEP